MGRAPPLEACSLTYVAPDSAVCVRFLAWRVVSKCKFLALGCPSAAGELRALGFTQSSLMGLFRRSRLVSTGPRGFGDCCVDMRGAMSLEVTRLLRVEDNGVLYMSVGVADTAEGPAWFDQAVIFCPFCGAKLQDRADIARQ